MQKLLLVDDNQDILEANRSYFEEQGFAATACASGRDAVAALQGQAYDCVVLDVMMPDMDGYAVCKAIRRASGVPVIFLSCLDRPDDKIRALMLGGDAYMTKPYDLRELHAQVLACLRREGQGGALPAFSIDREQRTLRLRERVAMLSQKEMALLAKLLDHPGETLGKERLCRELWPEEQADENRLHALMRKLRQKTDFAREQMGSIQSVYGSGYRLEPPGGMRDET